ILAVSKASVVDPSHARIMLEKGRDLLGVIDMALHSKRNRFDSLKQEKRVEGGENGAHRALINAAGAFDEGTRPKMLCVNHSVIGFVRLIVRSKTLRLFRPGEAPAIDDGATECCAVAAQKFCQ